MNPSSSPAIDRNRVEDWLDRLAQQRWTDEGRVALLVETPTPGEHVAREAVEAVPGEGLAGDHARKSFYKGALVPGREVTAVSREVLDLLGVDPIVVGDNLITEGIALHTLTGGERLQVGEEVVLRRTSKPHQPCTVFRDRTSPEAFAVVSRGYRGALFVIERGGTMRQGDPIRLLTDPA